MFFFIYDFSVSDYCYYYNHQHYHKFFQFLTGQLFWGLHIYPRSEPLDIVNEGLGLVVFPVDRPVSGFEGSRGSRRVRHQWLSSTPPL